MPEQNHQRHDCRIPQTKEPLHWTLTSHSPLPMPPASSPWPPRDADHLLVTSAEMAQLEQALFASGLPMEALMEKAALGVSRRLLAAPPAAAIVLVGPGHNGGDGLVVARELHLGGVPVRIWCPFERLKPLTEAHLRHALWLGIPRLEEPPPAGDSALWIDALFGIGQNRPPGEGIETLLQERQRRHPAALEAIDVPTGLCADRGMPLRVAAACARKTWCLGLLKRGLVQDSALHWVGELERIDLGLPPSLLQTLALETPLSLGPGDRDSAPWPPLDPAASKYGRGRLLVVAGSRRYRGAARLALRGASASGCGSLRAALPETVAEAIWSVEPHVVVQQSLAEAGDLSLADLTEDWLERLDAVLLGPGLGQEAAGAAGGEGPLRERWEQLRRFNGLLVLDADGINRLAERRPAGEDPIDWLLQRNGPSWLTPHPGEFARLFPAWGNLPVLEAASAAAKASGATVLLKGARSAIAAPDGRRWQLGAAAAATARAGLGDVLAGYAAGRGAMAVAANGPQPLDGALLAAAALDHALAGLAACREGRTGTSPMAVAERLERRSQVQ
jgi:hydroxyethylthiazole kinase-like uncharacterized protein yjeF